MTEDELQTLLDKTLPARDRYDVFVEEAQDQDIRLRFSLASGESWTTPALLTLVDTALRAATDIEATISHLNVTAIRPAEAADVIALSRVIRRNGDTAYAEVWLFSHTVVEAMLHAAATLTLRAKTPSRR